MLILEELLPFYSPQSVTLLFELYLFLLDGLPVTDSVIDPEIQITANSRNYSKELGGDIARKGKKA